MVGGCCLAGEVSANEGAEDRAGRPMGEGPERGWRSIAEGKLVSLSSSTRASGASSACSQCTCPKGPNAPNAQSQNAHSHPFQSVPGYLAKVDSVAQQLKKGTSLGQYFAQNVTAPTVTACTHPLKITNKFHLHANAKSPVSSIISILYSKQQQLMFERLSLIFLFFICKKHP